MEEMKAVIDSRRHNKLSRYDEDVKQRQLGHKHSDFRNTKNSHLETRKTGRG